MSEAGAVLLGGGVAVLAMKMLLDKWDMEALKDSQDVAMFMRAPNSRASPFSSAREFGLENPHHEKRLAQMPYYETNGEFGTTRYMMMNPAVGAANQVLLYSPTSMDV